MPLTVIDDEPLEPDVKVKPFVELSVRVPSLTERGTDSVVDADSVTPIAPAEKVNDPLTGTLTIEGAAIVGGGFGTAMT